MLLAGGIIGSALGVQAFTALQAKGQFELVVSLLYVVLLGTIGGLMLRRELRELRRRNDPNAVLLPRRRHTWAHGLPLKMRFRTSNLYVSAIPPFVIGLTVGILAAIMGVGGGFIMVPAMIYLIGMPTRVVIGTSVFQLTPHHHACHVHVHVHRQCFYSSLVFYPSLYFPRRLQYTQQHPHPVRSAWTTVLLTVGIPERLAMSRTATPGRS